jgi:hypothetical protein
MKMTARWIALFALLGSAVGSVRAAVPLNQLLITFGSLSEREKAIAWPSSVCSASNSSRRARRSREGHRRADGVHLR